MASLNKPEYAGGLGGGGWSKDWLGAPKHIQLAVLKNDFQALYGSPVVTRVCESLLEPPSSPRTRGVAVDLLPRPSSKLQTIEFHVHLQAINGVDYTNHPRFVSLIQAIIEEDVGRVEELLVSDKQLHQRNTGKTAGTGSGRVSPFERSGAITPDPLEQGEEDDSQVEALVHMVDSAGFSALHVAAAVGNPRIVQLLLAHQAIPSLKTLVSRVAPMHCAAWHGHAAALKLLIDSKADVNSRSQLVSTPLHGACFIGSRECVEMLLRANAEINASDSTRRTPLHYAAASGSLELVEFLLKRGGAPMLAAVDSNGHLPLHFAAEFGQVALVPLLIHPIHAPVNTRTLLGRTPLHLAVKSGCVRTTKAILSAGASVHLTEHDFGYTPLHTAVIYPSTSTGASTNAVAMLMALVGAGCDVNALDRLERTPLHFAAAIGNESLCHYLLENGAKVEARARNKAPPLKYAAQNGDKNVVKLLLERRANATRVDVNGESPLHVAAARDNTEAFALLLGYDTYARALKHIPIYLASRSQSNAKSSDSKGVSKSGASNSVDSSTSATKDRRKNEVPKMLTGAPPQETSETKERRASLTADQAGTAKTLDAANAIGALTSALPLLDPGTDENTPDNEFTRHTTIPLEDLLTIATIKGRTPLHYACFDQVLEQQMKSLASSLNDATAAPNAASSPMAGSNPLSPRGPSSTRPSRARTQSSANRGVNIPIGVRNARALIEHVDPTELYASLESRTGFYKPCQGSIGVVKLMLLAEIDVTRADVYGRPALNEFTPRRILTTLAKHYVKKGVKPLPECAHTYFWREVGLSMPPREIAPDLIAKVSAPLLFEAFQRAWIHKPPLSVQQAALFFTLPHVAARLDLCANLLELATAHRDLRLFAAIAASPELEQLHYDPLRAPLFLALQPRSPVPALDLDELMNDESHLTVGSIAGGFPSGPTSAGGSNLGSAAGDPSKRASISNTLSLNRGTTDDIFAGSGPGQPRASTGPASVNASSLRSQPSGPGANPTRARGQGQQAQSPPWLAAIQLLCYGPLRLRRLRVPLIHAVEFYNSNSAPPPGIEEFLGLHLVTTGDFYNPRRVGTSGHQDKPANFVPAQGHTSPVDRATQDDQASLLSKQGSSSLRSYNWKPFNYDAAKQAEEAATGIWTGILPRLPPPPALSMVVDPSAKAVIGSFRDADGASPLAVLLRVWMRWTFMVNNQHASAVSNISARTGSVTTDARGSTSTGAQRSGQASGGGGGGRGKPPKPWSPVCHKGSDGTTFPAPQVWIMCTLALLDAGTDIEQEDIVDLFVLGFPLAHYRRLRSFRDTATLGSRALRLFAPLFECILGMPSPLTPASSCPGSVLTANFAYLEDVWGPGAGSRASAANPFFETPALNSTGQPESSQNTTRQNSQEVVPPSRAPKFVAPHLFAPNPAAKRTYWTRRWIHYFAPGVVKQVATAIGRRIRFRLERLRGMGIEPGQLEAIHLGQRYSQTKKSAQDEEKKEVGQQDKRSQTTTYRGPSPSRSLPSLAHTEKTTFNPLLYLAKQGSIPESESDSEVESSDHELGTAALVEDAAPVVVVSSEIGKASRSGPLPPPKRPPRPAEPPGQPKDQEAEARAAFATAVDYDDSHFLQPVMNTPSQRLAALFGKKPLEGAPAQPNRGNLQQHRAEKERGLQSKSQSSAGISASGTTQGSVPDYGTELKDFAVADALPRTMSGSFLPFGDDLTRASPRVSARLPAPTSSGAAIDEEKTLGMPSRGIGPIANPPAVQPRGVVASPGQAIFFTPEFGKVPSAPIVYEPTQLMPEGEDDDSLAPPPLLGESAGLAADADVLPLPPLEIDDVPTLSAPPIRRSETKGSDADSAAPRLLEQERKDVAPEAESKGESKAPPAARSIPSFEQFLGQGIGSAASQPPSRGPPKQNLPPAPKRIREKEVRPARSLYWQRHGRPLKPGPAMGWELPADVTFVPGQGYGVQQQKEDLETLMKEEAENQTASIDWGDPEDVANDTSADMDDLDEDDTNDTAIVTDADDLVTDKDKSKYCEVQIDQQDEKEHEEEKRPTSYSTRVEVSTITSIPESVRREAAVTAETIPLGPRDRTLLHVAALSQRPHCVAAIILFSILTSAPLPGYKRQLQRSNTLFRAALGRSTTIQEGVNLNAISDEALLVRERGPKLDPMDIPALFAQDSFGLSPWDYCTEPFTLVTLRAWASLLTLAADVADATIVVSEPNLLQSALGVTREVNAEEEATGCCGNKKQKATPHSEGAKLEQNETGQSQSIGGGALVMGQRNPYVHPDQRTAELYGSLLGNAVLEEELRLEKEAQLTAMNVSHEMNSKFSKPIHDELKQRAQRKLRSKKKQKAIKKTQDTLKDSDTPVVELIARIESMGLAAHRVRKLALGLDVLLIAAPYGRLLLEAQTMVRTEPSMRQYLRLELAAAASSISSASVILAEASKRKRAQGAIAIVKAGLDLNPFFIAPHPLLLDSAIRKLERWEVEQVKKQKTGSMLGDLLQHHDPRQGASDATSPLVLSVAEREKRKRGVVEVDEIDLEARKQAMLRAASESTSHDSSQTGEASKSDSGSDASLDQDKRKAFETAAAIRAAAGSSGVDALAEAYATPGLKTWTFFKVLWDQGGVFMRPPPVLSSAHRAILVERILSGTSEVKLMKERATEEELMEQTKAIRRSLRLLKEDPLEVVAAALREILGKADADYELDAWRQNAEWMQPPQDLVDDIMQWAKTHPVALALHRSDWFGDWSSPLDVMKLPEDGHIDAIIWPHSPEEVEILVDAWGHDYQSDYLRDDRYVSTFSCPPEEDELDHVEQFHRAASSGAVVDAPDVSGVAAKPALRLESAVVQPVPLSEEPASAASDAALIMAELDEAGEDEDYDDDDMPLLGQPLFGAEPHVRSSFSEGISPSNALTKGRSALRLMSAAPPDTTLPKPRGARLPSSLSQTDIDYYKAMHDAVTCTYYVPDPSIVSPIVGNPLVRVSAQRELDRQRSCFGGSLFRRMAAPIFTRAGMRFMFKEVPAVENVPPSYRYTRQYAGEQATFYFIFTSFVQYYLIPVILTGIIFMYFHFGEGIDNSATAYNALIISLWSTWMLEMWTRKQSELAMHWDRRQFKNIERISLRFRPFRKANGEPVTVLNEITGEHEPYYPPARRNAKIAVSVLITLLMMGFVFTVHVFVLSIDNPGPTMQYVLSIGSAVIIQVTKAFYLWLAEVLTEWENHRLESDAMTSLNLKSFAFCYFNEFFSLYWIALGMDDSGEPAPERLFVQIVTLVATSILTNLALQQFIPWLRFRYATRSDSGWCCCFRNTGSFMSTLRRILHEETVGCKLYDTPVNQSQMQAMQESSSFVGASIDTRDTAIEEETEDPFLTQVYRYTQNGLNQVTGRRSARIFPLSSVRDKERLIAASMTELLRPPATRLFSDYLTIMILLGYIMGFAAIFPEGPILVLIAIWLERQGDLTRYLTVSRRVLPEPAVSIGGWSIALSFLSYASVISNGILIFYTNSSPPLKSEEPKFLFVCYVFALVLIKSGVSRVINDAADWVVWKETRADLKAMEEERKYGHLTRERLLSQVVELREQIVNLKRQQQGSAGIK